MRSVLIFCFRGCKKKTVMAFKPQIKLLVASKELQTSATIPNPSEEDRAAKLSEGAKP
jgi:hypothetical protein